MARKAIDKEIIKEYAILLAFVTNMEIKKDKTKKETPWWVKEFEFVRNKVINILTIYKRYEKLALDYFNRHYRGIDKQTREKEVILPLVAYVILERYKTEYENKKIGRGVVQNEDKLFDMYDELIEDIVRYYGKYDKQLINDSITGGEKLFYKLKEGK